MHDTKRYEAQLSMLCCKELPSGESLRLTGRIFILLPNPLPSDTLNGFKFGMGKLEWLGYSLVKVA